MTTEVVTGALLIILPIAYNALFTMLARSFDYPDILRRPTAVVLERFAGGGSRLILSWWAFAMSAVLLAPTAVLVSGGPSLPMRTQPFCRLLQRSGFSRLWFSSQV